MISTEQASDLLNRDGSCRDLNTNDLSFAEIGLLIENMNALYTLISAEDAEGIEIQDTLRNFQSIDQASFKGFHSRWQASEQLIRELQLFIAPEETGKYFAEISFFPDDIDRQAFSSERFSGLIDNLYQGIQTSQFYIRYESASWKFGDTADTSGVIAYGKNIHML